MCFFVVSFFSFFLGGLILLVWSRGQSFRLSLKDGLVLTGLGWAVISFFAALPFYLSGMTPSLIDAIFEAISSLTTTGITVLHEHAYFTASLKFWRVFLQWVGGIGVILLVGSFLPSFRASGGQLLLNEFSERSQKIMPRTSQISTALVSVYTGLIVVLAVLLRFTGLSLTQAFCLSIACISTGGILVSLDPIELFSVPCKILVCMGMFLGSLNFLWMVNLLRGQGFSAYKTDQMRAYGKLLLFMVFLVFLWKGKFSLNGILYVLSALSSTGFPLIKPDSFLNTLSLIFSFIGGCSGSTTGGLKVFRLQMLYRTTKSAVLRTLNPQGFFMPSYNGLPLTSKMLTDLLAVFFCYVGGWLFFSLALSAAGYQGNVFLLSASCLTNSGLNLSELYPLNNPSKMILIIEMLCGRFECITLLALIMRPDWRTL